LRITVEGTGQEWEIRLRPDAEFVDPVSVSPNMEFIVAASARGGGRVPAVLEKR